MTDARERRRERAQAQKKTDFAGGLKKYRVPLIIGLIWALIVAYNVAAAQGIAGLGGEDCPGHWHSTTDFYVEGRRVEFSQGPYDLDGNMPMSAHMHAPDDRTWHWEPPRSRCMDFREAAEIVDVTLGSGSIAFEGTHSITGSFADNDTHTWKVFSEKWEESWEPTSLSKVGSRQLQDGERVAFIYSPADDNGTALLGQVGPGPQGVAETSPGDGAFIAITMATIFALLAIVMWYNFAKKTW